MICTLKSSKEMSLLVLEDTFIKKSDFNKSTESKGFLQGNKMRIHLIITQ